MEDIRLGATTSQRQLIWRGEVELISIETNEREGEISRLVRDKLHRAALKGNWEDAEIILQGFPGAVCAPITLGKETALHIAVEEKHTTFVEELLKRMTSRDLVLQNDKGETAFCYTAKSGTVNYASKMLEINRALPLVRRHDGFLPIHVAVMSSQNSMALYLFSVTSFNDLNPLDPINLFTLTIESDMYEIGWKILENDPTLITEKDMFGQTALEILAQKPLVIGNISDLSLWKRCLIFCFEGLYNKALVQRAAYDLVGKLWTYIRELPEQDFSRFVDEQLHTIHAAAKCGNVELLTFLTRASPDLIWKTDARGHNLFHVAILYRQKNLFSLLREMAPLVKFASAVDNEENNVLHLAGKLAPRDRLNMLSGEALQMREELLWFKEIEKIVPSSLSRKRNCMHQMPYDIFAKEHEELRKAGEEWMKRTANNCMLVATLIATIVFAAAFTIPSGNNQEKGTPIFLGNNWFLVFFLSDAISLLSSSSSILIFLSILTSSYTDDDFLKSLPKKMLFGLITLFFSIVGMVLAFIAMSFLVFQGKTVWIPIVIIVLAGVPVILFVWLQWEFWHVLGYAAYGSDGLRKHRLF